MINQSIKVEQNLMCFALCLSPFIRLLARSVVLYGALLELLRNASENGNSEKRDVGVCGFICANLVGNRDISHFVTSRCQSEGASGCQSVDLIKVVQIC